MIKRRHVAGPNAISGLAAAIALIAVADLAAADVCVTCTGPDASYACAIDGDQLPSEDSRLKLLCITELAKAGGHQSCTVSRAVTAPCPGEVKKVKAQGLDQQVLPIAPPQEVKRPEPAPAPTATKDTVTTIPKTTEGPATVEKAVKDSADSAGDALEKTGEGAKGLAEQAGGAVQKAGKAVGDAATSTWRCLSTFFSEC
ncbi:MAG: hypothetical protein ACKVP4_01745 [Hyphomicrobium sp.]